MHNRMSARSLANGTSNDSTAQTSCSYFRDFSVQYEKFRKNPCNEDFSLIRRNVSLLSTMPTHQINLEQLETTQFFVDLHGLIGLLNKSDELWPAIAFLQNCTKNTDIRRALIEDYRFVPVLTLVLQQTQPLTEKSTRLLNLLQDLTFGISITWEEPYLHVLIDILKRTVIMATEEGEEKHAMLALSVIINLCYKNFPVLLLFMRTVNISEFSRKIQQYGALANKLMMVLSEDVHTPDLKELHLLLRSSFASIQECLRDWNVAHLKHIVDFLTDSKSHTGLHNAMLRYAKYCEDIERLLRYLEDETNINESKEETKKQHQLCLSLNFKLFLYILNLSSIPDKDGNENIISLDSIVPRLVDLICLWTESEICGTDAVRLLDGLVRFAGGPTLTHRIAKDSSTVSQLITTAEQLDTSSEHATAILQLLHTLLKQPKTEKLILSKISESFFDKIFSPQDTEKTIFCLLLLINFAEIAKKAYFEKCCTTLQLPQIQKALAVATLSRNAAVCDAVFQISQFEHFPRKAVANMLASLNSSCTELQNVSTHSVNGTQQLKNLNEILKTNRQFASTETEERLVALIESITSAQRNNQLNNVPTTQIMELYYYKIQKYECMEAEMQRNLDGASNEITQLRQRICRQNAELKKNDNTIYELQIKNESMDTQSGDLMKQRDELKRNFADLLKKSANQAESLQISEKRLSIKASELIVLNEEHSKLKEEMKVKNEQIERLENVSKEMAAKIDKLRKTVTAIEAANEEKCRLLADMEKQLAKTHKALESEKEAKKKSDDFIKVLEGQILEKNEEIRSYERELTETEEMRKTIMSLMESKKPKRK